MWKHQTPCKVLGSRLAFPVGSHLWVPVLSVLAKGLEQTLQFSQYAMLHMLFKWRKGREDWMGRK
jgi:hypothetical protein